MSAPNHENAPVNDKMDWTETESPNTILVCVDAIGDTTVRPSRPEIPLDYWPRPRAATPASASGQTLKLLFGRKRM